MMLELKDYCPIDLEKVKHQRSEMFNLPGMLSGWGPIEAAIIVINDESLPSTLRLWKLNTLPHHMISFLGCNCTKKPTCNECGKPIEGSATCMPCTVEGVVKYGS